MRAWHEFLGKRDVSPSRTGSRGNICEAGHAAGCTVASSGERVCATLAVPLAAVRVLGVGQDL